MHFLARNNTYAFFRYNDQEAVFVFANAAEEPRTIPTETYAEILGKYNARGINPLTGETENAQMRPVRPSWLHMYCRSMVLQISVSTPQKERFPAAMNAAAVFSVSSLLTPLWATIRVCPWTASFTVFLYMAFFLSVG